MFCVIKSKLDNPIVRMLVGESAGDKSTEATDNKIVEFRRRDDFNLYGWIENDKILGVCGIEVFPDWVEIYNIAVVPEIRKRGIGKAMITAVQQKYQTNVKAETDDGAVEFYRKCGFKIEGFIKTYSGVESQRYKCVLNYNSGCRK
ncbi:MAG: GNAT family N-acetyltransferase [Oscillospiraceae bacterium]|nr:GNAT family N-acetyltransferase [Oscillospiraceae bacterium]